MRAYLLDAPAFAILCWIRDRLKEREAGDGHSPPDHLTAQLISVINSAKMMTLTPVEGDKS